MSKSIAQVTDLIDDPEIIAKYEEYHRNAWPEIREKQKAIGIERMEIFRSGNHLFMYITAPDDFDFDADFIGFKPTPRNQEWQDIMSTMLQKVPEATDGELWSRVPTVFDSEWFQEST
ncbi:MAG: L-rhamnose mutarotase [Chloroflexi bacterium]|jgi:L-rhamnose mutarotase|nr:L-rhamnose mutarotase [Chloroflexota bacterium]